LLKKLLLLKKNLRLKILQMMKANSIDKNNLICIASIGKPKGLKGEFFLNSFCNPAENILNYSNIIIEANKLANFNIEYIKKVNSKFISKVINIDNVDDIKKFTNLKLYISKEELPKLEVGQVYWHDLIDLNVIDFDSGDILGQVQDLNNFGSNDCLEIIPTKDSVDNIKRLIPFVENKIIKSIEKEKSIIYVNWPKDFLV
jgi:16S rRNA processing protein RimM